MDTFNPETFRMPETFAHDDPRVRHWHDRLISKGAVKKTATIKGLTVTGYSLDGRLGLLTLRDNDLTVVSLGDHINSLKELKARLDKDEFVGEPLAESEWDSEFRYLLTGEY